MHIFSVQLFALGLALIVHHIYFSQMLRSCGSYKGRRLEGMLIFAPFITDLTLPTGNDTRGLFCLRRMTVVVSWSPTAVNTAVVNVSANLGTGERFDLFAWIPLLLIGLLLDVLAQDQFVHGARPESICALQHDRLSAQHPVANIDRAASVNFAIDCSGGRFNMCHTLDIYASLWCVCVCVLREVFW